MVTVYSKDNCHQCKLVKLWLLQRDIPFTTLNIQEPDNIALAKGHNIAAAPMTIIAAGEGGAEEVFGGFRADRLGFAFPAASFPATREVSLGDVEVLAPTPKSLTPDVEQKRVAA